MKQNRTKRYIRLTPLRYYYETAFDDTTRNEFIEFVRKTRGILREVVAKKGSLFYVIGVLDLIRDEENIAWMKQRGRDVPYLWTLYSRKLKPVLMSETNLQITEKASSQEPKPAEPENLPEQVIHALNKINDLSQLMIQKIPGRGDLTITCNLSLNDNSREYFLQATHKVYMHAEAESSCSSEETRKRGRRGEPQSDVAMYLLYRYFRALGITNVYEKIAVLTNNYSRKFFRPPMGAALSNENVRKRIQWLKKRPDLLSFAEAFSERLQQKTKEYYLPELVLCTDS